MSERLFTAAEVQAAVEAVIIYERQRTARLLAEHSMRVNTASGMLMAAAKANKPQIGRYVTPEELADLV